MKQILKLILLLVIGQTALAQAPSNYVNINGRYRWIAGMFDSTFHIPKGTTPSLRTGGSTNGGALFYKTADSSLQLYTGTQWLRMLKVGDTTGMLTPYFNSVGVGLKNTGQTVYADTLLLSTRLWRNKGIDSVQANLTAGLATKLNISDTASMLSPYARTVNVRQIVSDSLGGLVRLKALNAGGAALYANSGTKVAEWGLGGSANMDFHGFAGYDINRASSYTVRSFTDKNYVDSAISASPSGTVTSVATNTGTGITGGTITTSGTIAADTLLLSTRAWRQKGIDSVAALANTKISGSGTTNYIPKFTSSSAIVNSQIFDNGTSVGINTASPVAMLDVNGAGLIRGFLTTTDAIKLGANTSAPTSTDAFIYRPADNTLAFGTASSERMRLTSGGSLGIGTSSPSAKLDVVGSAGIRVNEDGAGTKIITIRSDWAGVDPAINVTTNNSLLFLTNNTERMRLDASGNLGINTSSPSYKLDVNGSINGTSIYVTNTDGYLGNINSTGANGGYFAFSTSGAVIADIGTSQQIFGSGGNDMFGINARGSRNLAFGTNNTERMRITSGGNVLVGTTTFYTGNLSGSASGLNINASIPISLLRESGTGNTFYNGIASSTIYSGTQNSIPYAFVTNDIERMRITSGGQVGIGTSNPNVYGNGFTNQFTVSTTSGYANITVAGSSGNSGGIDFGNQTVRHAGVYGLDGSDLGFYTNGSNSGSGLTERMRITSGGELLINTTSDAGDYKLQVNGNVYGDKYYASGPNAVFSTANAGTGASWMQVTNNNGTLYLGKDNNAGTSFGVANAAIIYNTGNSDMVFWNNSQEAFRISATGSIKTAAPSGGTAAAWKLGERVASAGVTFNDQQYIQLDIGGTLYYLATVDLPMPEAYPQATSGPSNNYKIAPVQVKTTRDAEIEKLRKEIEELKQLIKNK